MSKVLHVQEKIHAPIARVFHALTDSAELESWFAEHADVSLEEKRYDFWGRFTPEAPSRDHGRHPIEIADPDTRLRFGWRFRGGDTHVDLRLVEQDHATIVSVRHHDIPRPPAEGPNRYAMEDVWFLSLENLRRHIHGCDVVRCDFTRQSIGQVTHTIEIDGPRDAVWSALIDPSQLNRWIASDARVEPTRGGNWDLGWGDVGQFEILSIEPKESLAVSWSEAGKKTVVTWTLEESGGKTRLTIVHSGFAPDRPVDEYDVGWLQYLVSIKSLVEFGIEWLPPIKEIAKDVAVLYATSIWARQDELMDADDARPT